MISSIFIKTQAQGTALYRYQVAGRLLLCDIRIPTLESYRCSSHNENQCLHRLDVVDQPREKNQKEVAKSRGWVLDGWFDVSLSRNGKWYRLDIDGIGHFWLDFDHQIVLAMDPRLDIFSERFAHILLGAPLLLMLAGSGIWSLHGSAIEFDGKTAVFLAESGGGKSTLANIFYEASCTRLADDILPIEQVGSKFFARHRFPQLKLPLSASITSEESAEVTAIYLLNREQGPRGKIHKQTISDSERLLRIVKHSVCSRLFTPVMLRQHLGFCKSFASECSVSLLSYPSGKNYLPSLMNWIIDDLSRESSV